MLRRGSNHSAKYWRKVLQPVIDRYLHLDIPRYSRRDAAFAIPSLFSFLLKDKGFRYAIRIKANPVLMEKISHFMTRHVGRPSFKAIVFFHSFRYQAGSWDFSRRMQQR
tara:strand:- start:621 stop:947 length:327 start_codon:yes stop_codon:yes gene_type:complete